MGIDLTDLPVTDFHCFSFARTPRLSEESLARIFLGGGPTVMSVNLEVRLKDLPSSMAYRRMMFELSRFLNVKDVDDVLKMRNARVRDFRAYVESLFEEVNIERLVLDNGLEPVKAREFAKYNPAKVERVFRIEPLLKSLVEDSRSFEDLFESFDEAISSAVKKEGYVGFKSVIAYRTGLDVESSETDARKSFRDSRAGKEEVEWFGPRVKPLRDFLLFHVAERCIGLRTFLQIHTGVGDTDVLAAECSPLLLKNFLKEESVLKIPVILIHGGFPFTSEAAWLANVFPNVYFELSTPLPPIFEPAISKARFREVIETVPVSRIVYGSDAHEIPENHWMSALLSKRALGEALGEVVREGVMDEDQARRDGERIFSTNAGRLLRR